MPEYLPKEFLQKLLDATPETIAEVEHLLMLSPHSAPQNGRNELGDIYAMFRELSREIVSLREILAARRAWK